jgi:hypothetical protein
LKQRSHWREIGREEEEEEEEEEKEEEEEEEEEEEGGDENDGDNDAFIARQSTLNFIMGTRAYLMTLIILTFKTQTNNSFAQIGYITISNIYNKNEIYTSANTTTYTTHSISLSLLNELLISIISNSTDENKTMSISLLFVHTKERDDP